MALPVRGYSLESYRLKTLTQPTGEMMMLRIGDRTSIPARPQVSRAPSSSMLEQHLIALVSGQFPKLLDH